jgi:hypothetical protein
MRSARDRAAFWSLQFVTDRSVRSVGSAAHPRAPMTFILADHGQAGSISFAEVTGGKPLERLLFDGS